MIIRTRTPARAGLIGNPSDGFNGVTIAFTFDAFWAEVALWESPELEILPSARDITRFASIEDLVRTVSDFGHYGGIRLIKAIIKVFADYCWEHAIALDDRNFTISYRSTIPLRVGLAGSSAIITSAFKALMQFYGVSISQEIMPNLILKAETQELKIGAGLQDRVAQVYGGLVYMDFNREVMSRGYGHYESLDPRLLPPLYIAYDDSSTEGTEVFHNDVRERYARGEKLVMETMEAIAENARSFRKALTAGDIDEMNWRLNRNFDLRSQIYRINVLNRRLIETARALGASSKFCGSGGAVLGICRDDEMFYRLQEAYQAMGVSVVRPHVVAYGVDGGQWTAERGA
jgi:glucuronokinase